MTAVGICFCLAGLHTKTISAFFWGTFLLWLPVQMVEVRLASPTYPTATGLQGGHVTQAWLQRLEQE